jgi:hypothetical protein
MKRLITIIILLMTTIQFKSNAQESHGNTLNLGVGIGGHYGYYRYVGSSLPILHIDYEFSAAKNFTLAPFVNIHAYSRSYYYGNDNHPYKNYRYRETGLAMGVKGTYYFDDIVNAGSKWDFYLAGSLGYMAVFSRWDDDYDGDRNYYYNASPLYLDFHIGTEFHVNSRLGLFLDLSTGVSTFGIAIH